MFLDKIKLDNIFDILHEKHVITQWKLYYQDISISDDIIIKQLITAKLSEHTMPGIFYNLKTGEAFEHTITYTVYFYKDNTKLAVPEIIPNPNDIIYIQDNNEETNDE